MKFNWKTIVMVLSLILNALGGTGTVKPIVDLRAPASAPAHP